MTERDRGRDRADHGEASLGEAQAADPPEDPEMIFDDADAADGEVEGEGESGFE